MLGTLFCIRQGGVNHKVPYSVWISGRPINLPVPDSVPLWQEVRLILVTISLWAGDEASSLTPAGRSILSAIPR
ncbi:hypothetical protein GJ744_001320 [Endocarpon pusillum]|uniref:Uncharacterized protein n=1 Tax=Endocarpon pusillum TaxID=364733 RepID=A0A8H7ANB6_9EURO|nr:hypothetical protein GJ744_001320 [Endocarpon pusillum]